ncbi:hypothetical protein KXW09_006616 [Aspergillus fumigatus]|nr:hypothetical protein KXW09_006616 [Aspergillus fumigatus]
MAKASAASASGCFEIHGINLIGGGKGERWNHDASGDSQEQGVPEDKVLDDPARYNFDDGSEDSRRQVLVRIPGITDFVA